MANWVDMLRATSKEELNKLSLEKKLTDNEMKRRELALKDRLAKVDYLSKLGVDAEKVMNLPRSPSGGDNNVEMESNIPFIG